ncbi:MAG TPA: YceD family protein [Arenimonas sp.]|jgi:uncharacterized protein|nr:YceD family protein [Arenimonas sp.]HOZ05753.1 YceD family protein [Arenimonas sp.]HPO23205.1 YceD family protein [Arenimonas sp.]HPW32217.1 YceD family protein [Arenimonas sp.]
MSATLPLVLDAWRMVATGRRFEGLLPLAGFKRLGSSLIDAEGDCHYVVEFGRDDLGQRYVDLHLQAQLPLLCQRTLERFFYPVDIRQRLGLIRDEAEEAALLPDVEAVLVDDNGSLHPADLIEDELILALPVVPINPDSEAIEAEWPADMVEIEEETPNPFAALSALKDLKR